MASSPWRRPQRGRGLGTLLIEAVESFASGAGVRWLDGEGRERELRAVTGLLGRRGYVELERYQASRQEPGSVDTAIRRSSCRLSGT